MLTLICGMPRAGKTTYALANYCNIIHLDNIGYEAVKAKVKSIRGDVAVDGIYNHPQLRAELVQAYKGHGARCIWLDTPLEIRRTRPRWHQLHGMDFFPPTFTEGWDEIIVIKGENNVESIDNKRQG